MGPTIQAIVHAAAEVRPAVAEAVDLARAAKACPFSSRDRACGCNGIRCGLKPSPQQIVAIQTCMECIKKYG